MFGTFLFGWEWILSLHSFVYFSLNFLLLSLWGVRIPPKYAISIKTEHLNFHLVSQLKVAQSVECTNPGGEALGSIPAPYWLGWCQYNVTDWDRSHGLPALSRVWQHVKLSDVSLGARLRYGLVVEEDVKKPTKQTSLLLFMGHNSSVHIDVLLKW